MTITLITGANRGLGLETARRLVEAGHTVYLGARDARRGREAAERIGARTVEIDVTSDRSVQAAAQHVRDEAGVLDVLVNNAAIVEERKPSGDWPTVGDTTGAGMERVYATNVFGLVRVTHAFLPVLRASSHPVVVNVSSSGGSLTRTSDPDNLASQFTLLAYPSSKSAVNMITVQYANAFADIKFNAVCPGYTATGLNDNQGTQTVEEGAEIIVRMATVGPDGPTGGFFEAVGPVPW